MIQEIAAAGQLSCGQVAECFNLSQPTISHHLGILANAGVIVVREAGQHRFIWNLHYATPQGLDGAAGVWAPPGRYTVQLTVGWTLTLHLGAPGRRFSVPAQSGGSALHELGQPRRSGTEVIASFRAVRPGTSELRATEGPVCRRGRACPDYLALWTLTVRVSGRR